MVPRGRQAPSLPSSRILPPAGSRVSQQGRARRYETVPNRAESATGWTGGWTGDRADRGPGPTRSAGTPWDRIRAGWVSCPCCRVTPLSPAHARPVQRRSKVKQVNCRQSFKKLFVATVRASCVGRGGDGAAPHWRGRLALARSKGQTAAARVRKESVAPDVSIA